VILHPNVVAPVCEAAGKVKGSDSLGSDLSFSHLLLVKASAKRRNNK
jgi:hypothetical protein